MLPLSKYSALTLSSYGAKLFCTVGRHKADHHLLILHPGHLRRLIMLKVHFFPTSGPTQTIHHTCIVTCEGIDSPKRIGRGGLLAHMDIVIISVTVFHLVICIDHVLYYDPIASAFSSTITLDEKISLVLCAKRNSALYILEIFDGISSMKPRGAGGGKPILQMEYKNLIRVKGVHRTTDVQMHACLK